MDSLITSYGINFQEFQLTLINLNAVVAGSSALAVYFKQEGIEPGYEPNDIDIFVPGRIEHIRDEYGYPLAGQIVIKSFKTMKDFLAQYGFIENDKFGIIDSIDSKYYGSLTRIQKITSFTNASGKEIQVIIIDSYSIVQDISKDFDISACITWYDAHSNCLKTMDPDTTKRKEMYYIRLGDTEELQKKNKVRAEKYISRGFKLIEKPCPFIDARDTRTQLSHTKFDNIEVMDIFTLEDIPIRDYLQKSTWNIILKTGKTYYAFERKALMDYMKKKSTNVNRIGTVYETPFNQCITPDAYQHLLYADYTIYELKNAYSVSAYDGRVKSLFNISCYSINDWIKGEEGEFCKVPPQVGTRVHLPELSPGRSNLQEVLNVSLDDILAAHAHLMVPSNLEAFHTAIREINRGPTY